MRLIRHAGPWPRASLAFVLTCLLLGVLWLAGGASRADALGQVVVRSFSVLLLVVAILWGKPPRLGEFRPVWLMLAAALVLVLLQLVPLPPGLWQALPGRGALAEAALASGQPQPWRPWSIVPGATANAAASLVVPLTMLVLVASIDRIERRHLVTALLMMVSASAGVGLLQFAGLGFNNPFINETVGQVGGTFANRNHFALFLAIGCLVAPVWAFQERRQPDWRGPVTLGLTLLFVLAILATGSRAGLVLGTIALALGLVMIRGNLKRMLRRYPPWIFQALIAGVVVLLALVVLVSVAADRAVSIDRVFAIDQGQDMRTRGLPTVLAMIRTYFPVGIGMGGFDPVFRMHEPFALLRVTYFNHAHNDLVEVVLEAGVAGLLLVLAGLLWWAWASVHAWREGRTIAMLGSAILLLIMIASAFDYPARTPAVMAITIIAAAWLSASAEDKGGSALPRSGQHL